MKLLSLLFFVMLVYFSKQESLPKNFKVLGAFEMIRHGARTPLIKESHSELYFGTQRSQLTVNGFRQHILLGRWLRRRYVLGDTYPLLNKDLNKLDLDEVYFKSANFQRAVFSATAHLLGVFPKSIIKLKYEGHEEIKTNDIPPVKNYIPDLRDGREVTINVVNKDKDNLFKISNCKVKGSNLTLKEEILKYHRTQIFKLTDQEIKDAIDDILTHYEHVVLKRKHKTVDTEVDGNVEKTVEKEVKKNLKKNDNADVKKREIPKYSLATLNKFISALRPFKYHNKMKISLKQSTLLTIKKHVLNKFYEVRITDSPQKVLYSSKLFHKLDKFFTGILEKKSKRKFVVLSGFDRNISDVISNLFDLEYLRKSINEALTDLRTYRMLVPPLASSLIFELIQVEGDKTPYVRIVYNGRIITGNFSKPIKVMHNSGLLNLEDFRSLLTSKIDQNYKNVQCGEASAFFF